MSGRTRFLLVRVEDDLDGSRFNALFHSFAQKPGVVCVYNALLTGLPPDRLETLTGGRYRPEQREPPEVQLTL